MTCAQCTPTKLCHWCARKAAKKEKAKQGIKKESEKRAKENRQYNKDNKVFAAQNATCAAFLFDKETGIQCDGIATTTHHMYGRLGGRLTDFTGCVRLCGRHHEFIELHPDIAKEIGLSGSRLNIEQ